MHVLCLLTETVISGLMSCQVIIVVVTSDFIFCQLTAVQETNVLSDGSSSAVMGADRSETERARVGVDSWGWV